MFESNLLNDMVTTHSNQNMLIGDIRQIIESGRRQAYASVNASMIVTYWNIGRRIVEEEQHGEARAEYGKNLLGFLASELKDYGDNFSERRLRDYRQFYLYFNNLEIWHSRVPNLTWTHFRHLLRIDEDQVRLWYMNEAATQLWIGQQRTLHHVGRQATCAIKIIYEYIKSKYICNVKCYI